MPFYFHKRRKKEKNQVNLIQEGLQGRSVVLLGIMGAGKTVLGRKLAGRLGLPFIDSDYEIEAAAGMSVADIFEIHGEAHFREGEKRVISRLLGEEQKVLATGGGAFVNEETRGMIKDSSVSVWLNAELDVLMERVMKRDTRPLLQTENPRAVMAGLMEERYPLYGQADISVMSKNLPQHVMVDKIMDALADYFARDGAVPSVKSAVEQ